MTRRTRCAWLPALTSAIQQRGLAEESALFQWPLSWEFVVLGCGTCAPYGCGAIGVPGEGVKEGTAAYRPSPFPHSNLSWATFRYRSRAYRSAISQRTRPGAGMGSGSPYE